MPCESRGLIRGHNPGEVGRMRRPRSPAWSWRERPGWRCHKAGWAPAPHSRAAAGSGSCAPVPAAPGRPRRPLAAAEQVAEEAARGRLARRQRRRWSSGARWARPRAPAPAACRDRGSGRPSCARPLLGSTGQLGSRAAAVVCGGGRSRVGGTTRGGRSRYSMLFSPPMPRPLSTLPNSVLSPPSSARAKPGASGGEDRARARRPARAAGSASSRSSCDGISS